VKKVLVIHFGQLGDVILGLPALDAIRARFAESHLTVMTGTPADQVVRLAGLADRVVGVDRWALKRAPKAKAVAEIARIARRLRAERYGAVVDLHAFYETGLMALATGAPLRVGPKRENRSLPFAYTATATEDRSLHLIDRYLAVAAAAGATMRTLEPRLEPAEDDDLEAERRLTAVGATSAPVVGLNPGAGWEIRKWPAERFVALGRAMVADGARVVVFAGPEEPGLGHEIAGHIGEGAAGVEGLTLGQLAAVMRRCALVVSNDTGPSHIAASVGAPTIALMPGNAGPSACAIRGERCHLLYGETILAIEVDEVVAAARAVLRHV
jgi:heptosyltransferase-1